MEQQLLGVRCGAGGDERTIMGDQDLSVNVIKEGYLGKKMKHNIIKKVQPRYFKLLDYELLYWKKKEQADAGEEPLAYIPLKVRHPHQSCRARSPRLHRLAASWRPALEF